MTIRLTDTNKIYLDSENTILNGEKQITALVHQYDEKGNLTEIILKKYGIIYKQKNKMLFPFNFLFYFDNNYYFCYFI